jgi:hypothetical protein
MGMSRKLVSAACAVMASAAVSVFGLSGAAHAATGVVLIVNAHTFKCVDAATQGTAVTQQTCTVPGQWWDFRQLSADGSSAGQIVNVTTGLCLDIQSFTNAGRVVQLDCGQQPAGTFWSYVSAGTSDYGDIKYQIKSAFTNFCLDLENGLSTDGLSLQVWQCNNNTDNQHWVLAG